MCRQHLRSICRILLLPLLFPLCSVRAQPLYEWSSEATTTYRFEAITAEKGLPHGRVQAIHQDSFGFMWLGTPVGLVRYDGFEFKTYQYLLPDSIAFREGRPSLPVQVLAIAEAPGGDLWIGCRKESDNKPSVFRFDRSTDRLEPYFFKDGRSQLARGVNDILIGEEYVWLNTNPLIRIKRESLQKGAEAIAFDKLEKEYGGMDPDGFATLARDERGRFWFSAYCGIYEWLPEVDSFQFHPLTLPVPEDSPLQIYPFMEVRDAGNGWLWTTSNVDGYIVRYHPDSGRQEFFKPEKEFLTFYTQTLLSRSGKLWIGMMGGRGGLRIFDPDTERLQIVDAQVDDDLYFPWLRIQSMFEDRSGNIWIGTEYGPLLKFEPQRNQFHWLRFRPDQGASLPFGGVYDLEQDEKGKYWLAVFGGGLVQWDKAKNSFLHLNAKKGNDQNPATDYVMGLDIAPDGRVWFGEGFSSAFYDPETERFQHYPEGGTVTSVLWDSQNRLWLTKFGGGLRRYDPMGDHFEIISMQHPEDTSRWINPNLRGIMEDSRGDLWLGSHSPGLAGCFRFDPETERFEPLKVPEAHAFSEDAEGNVWIASADGLYRYDPKSKSLRRFGMQDGLPSNNVHSVVADDASRLWVGTSNGLSRLDLLTGNIRNYFGSDGLPGIRFHASTYKNAQGELFFGSSLGLLYFHPDSIRENPVVPELAITGLDLFGKPLVFGEDEMLDKPVGLTRSLEFPYWQNDLTIHYAALHFKNPDRNRYRVWLMNNDPDWREVGTMRFANYTNLDPGHYTFFVQGANSDGKWNTEPIALDILIHPPWWKTTLAYILYAILAGGMFYGFYRIQLQRQLDREEARRMAELDELKSRLYTNITHEFRTPLTVILGLTDILKGQLSGAMRDKIRLVRQNGQKLLRLVNDMLDLARLEAGNLSLHPVQADIVPFLGYLTESFQSLAQQRRIDLCFESGLDSLEMDYDPDRLQQVITNLISNALKFTPEGGIVCLRACRERDTGCLRIDVTDTGKGISQVDQKHLFDRFFQVEAKDTRRGEGTGIGLAIVSELVRQMDGTVQVESALGEGSTFSVRLPVTNLADLEEKDPESVRGEVEKSAESQLRLTHIRNRPGIRKSKPKDLILVVEDNDHLVYYLRSCLEDRYQILTAPNGQVGLELAREKVPDIIISDVMMPEMDGFALCRALKKNPITSHIPIILLTAKATPIDRLTGLQQGADAYLTKPFDRPELEARLRQLVALRRRLRRKFGGRNGRTEKTGSSAFGRENAFMQRLKAIISSRYQDEGFGVEDLAEALQMSRVQLYRKLKALTGQTASGLIREVRLAKAREMLANTPMRVGEVAGAVGFRDPGYFSRVYRETFSESPSETKGE